MKNKYNLVLAISISIFVGCIFGLVAYSICANNYNQLDTKDIEILTKDSTIIKSPKTTLTFSEIRDMKKPYGAVFEKWNSDNSIKTTGRIVYGINGYIFDTDIHLIGKEESSIEDGMIYTIGNCIDDNGKACEVLFIHNPNDLSWVAASITYEDGSHGLFTFFDKDGRTIYEKENK